jgi:N-acetylmuramoyl-L-alanine amidase
VKRSSLITVLSSLLLASAAAAQAPRLQVAGASAIAGITSQGSPAFPLAALEALGARVTTTPLGARALLLGDTIEFQAGSPFFRAGGRLYQLAFPTALAGGELHVPEQFFLQWLPQRHAGEIRYADGALRSSAAPARSVPRGPPQKRLVVLDPGHGGRDPGKIGPNGLAEKEAVLEIAKRLATVLRERGYEVQLTRTRDTLIALADRPRLANRWKGDRPVALFVSIHANSAPGGAQGFETFFLSEARTEDERRVAEMENAAAAYEEEKPAGDEFEHLLNSLRNDFYVRASSDLAGVIQDRFATFHPGPNRGVKRAGFRVLVGAIMPAVLVEVAFLSHRGEAELLRTDRFQGQVARGLADAVDRFFTTNEYLWVEAGSQ